MLKIILNAHPDVQLAGEFPLLPALADHFSPLVNEKEADALLAALVECDTYNHFCHRTFPPELTFPAQLSVIYRHLIGSNTVTWAGNKTPQNSENIDRLEALFPGSRYILIVRDVRDVALSWHKKWGKDPYLCAHKWQYRMRHAVKLLEAHAPGRHTIIKYESLIDNHAATAQGLCTFLGLEYSDNMANYHDHVEDVIPGKLNYGMPILKENSQKWRTTFSDSKVLLIESIAFDAMELFGYSPIFASGPKPISFFRKALGWQRDLMAMVAVGNRALGRLRHRSIYKAIGLEFSKRFGRFRLKQ